MTLTPSQQRHCLIQLLNSIEANGSESFDARFIPALFHTDSNMQLWAESWNLSITRYQLIGINKKVGKETLPIDWIEMSVKREKELILLEGEDEEL